MTEHAVLFLGTGEEKHFQNVPLKQRPLGECRAHLEVETNLLLGWRHSLTTSFFVVPQRSYFLE